MDATTIIANTSLITKTTYLPIYCPLQTLYGLHIGSFGMHLCRFRIQLMMPRPVLAF